MAGGSVLLLCAAIAWAGGDLWKDKPYQQWDEKDISKILGDSPWARIVHVEAPWRAHGAHPVAAAGAPASGGPAQPSGGMGKMGGSGGGYGTSGGSAPAAPQQQGGIDEGGAAPQAAYVIDWESSRTIREALARRAVLQGSIKEEQAEEILKQPVEEYQIFVYGPDMTPFLNAEEETLKSGAFLMTKKGKQKVAPDKIQILKTEDGKSVAKVMFLFPRKLPSGEEFITPSEKGAEFECKAGKTTLRSSFDFGKMADKQGLDL